YYGEKCLGNPDGGAVVGQLIFEALSRYEAARK
ncbi:Dak phosphatase, partial [Enterocloster asparagiformis]